MFERGLASARLALVLARLEWCLGGLGVGMSAIYCFQLTRATP